MIKVSQIIYCRLTRAELFNINKPKGAEEKGGGQTYIDFPTKRVSAANWQNFLNPSRPVEKIGGPLWTVNINSMGLKKSQTVRIGQRRPASISIREQTLDRQTSNRIHAWHPRNGFPAPAKTPGATKSADPSVVQMSDNIVVYLMRDDKAQIWAGWFEYGKPGISFTDKRLAIFFSERAGYLVFDSPISVNENDQEWMLNTPIKSISSAPVLPSLSKAAPSTAPKLTGKSRPKTVYLGKQRTDEELVSDLFAEDETTGAGTTDPVIKEAIRKVRKRNIAAVRLLKQLYNNRCQITGDEFAFERSDGTNYTEAHHIIPLGKNGADDPSNLIVVSAHIHKMLHYAAVSQINLADIKDGKLPIEINGKTYNITWHPEHAKRVLSTSAS